MITFRKSEDRGAVKMGWLDTKHTFSFGNYYDPKHMGFGDLRVINDDIVAPASGFGTHPHDNMEIVTYVMEGELEHKDSLGTGSVIMPGDVQRMSAGTGIRHSEFNPQKDKQVHLLQIWILPDKKGFPPSYEQKNFAKSRENGKFTLLASNDGREGSLTVHQDIAMYVLDLEKGKMAEYKMGDNRIAWLHVANGKVILGDKELKQGDGAAVEDEKMLKFTGIDKADILIFDMAK